MSLSREVKLWLVVMILLLMLPLDGCGMMKEARKPEIGPAGKTVESKPNPPVLERFASAPETLYDLEAASGKVFEGMNKADWQQAEAGLYDLQLLWDQARQTVGEKKGVKEADSALAELASGVQERDDDRVYEQLTKFTSSLSDIGKSYKLSPVADLIAVGGSVRNVAYFVEGKNWIKAYAKAKELEGGWNQVKPSMEQVGVLGDVTTAHSSIKQLKDAVNAENKGAAEEHITELNESLGRIREFYRGE